MAVTLPILTYGTQLAPLIATTTKWALPALIPFIFTNLLGTAEASEGQKCNSKEVIRQIAERLEIYDDIDLRKECFSVVYKLGKEDLIGLLSTFSVQELQCLVDENGRSLLKKAVDQNDVLYVKKILDEGIYKHDIGELAHILKSAAKNGSLEIVDNLWRTISMFNEGFINSPIIDSKPVSLVLCRIGNHKSDCFQKMRIYNSASAMMQRIQSGTGLDENSPKFNNPNHEAEFLLARLYAVQRQWNPDNEEVAKEFSQACELLGENYPKEALNFIKQSIQQQKKSAKCVFPCVVATGEKLLRAVIKEASSISSWMKDNDFCYWSSVGIELGVDIAGLFVVYESAKVVGEAVEKGGKFGFQKAQNVFYKLGNYAPNIGKWVPWTEKMQKIAGRITKIGFAVTRYMDPANIYLDWCDDQVGVLRVNDICSTKETED